MLKINNAYTYKYMLISHTFYNYKVREKFDVCMCMYAYLEDLEEMILHP